jgi:hypothetical protein
MCARKFGWGLSSTARDCRRMVHDVYLRRTGRISESGDAGSGKIDVSIVGMVGRLKCGDAVNETDDFFAKISRRLTHLNSTGSRRLVRTRRWTPRRARAIPRSGSHPDAGTWLDSQPTKRSSCLMDRLDAAEQVKDRSLRGSRGQEASQKNC